MPAEGGGEHPSGKILLGTLVFPNHKFDPEWLLNFTELKGFQQDWKGLGLNVEEDLACLQVEIMMDPERGDVIPGTSGLRKMRFSPPNWNRGKRGALRILYVHFPEIGHVLLVIAYSKNDDQDLSRGDRKRIKELIEEERQVLQERHFS